MKYQKISEEYLKKNEATMEIVDGSLSVVSSKGKTAMTGHQYTPIEFSVLLQNESRHQNVAYKAVKDPDGKEYTIVLMQEVMKKTLRKENAVNSFYTFGLLFGTLSLLLVIFSFLCAFHLQADQ